MAKLTKRAGRVACGVISFVGTAIVLCSCTSPAAGPLDNGMADGNQACQANSPDGRGVLYSYPIIRQPVGAGTAVLDSIDLIEPSGLVASAAYTSVVVELPDQTYNGGLTDGMPVPPTKAELKEVGDHGVWSARAPFAGTRVEPGALGVQLGLVLNLTGKGDGTARGYRISYHVGSTRYVTESHSGLLVPGVGRTCAQMPDLDLTH